MSQCGNPRAGELVSMAVKLFARHGYEGVSVRDICSALSVNCSIISYYFGGKKGLYLAVLRDQLAVYWLGLEQALNQSGDAVAQLLAVVDGLQALLIANPYFAPLMTRELAGPSPEFLQVVQEYQAVKGDPLAKLIRSGQRQGIFKAGFRAEQLALMTKLLFTGSAAAKALTPSANPSQVESDYFEAVKTILLKGILAEDGGGGRILGKQTAKPRTGPLGR